MDADLKKILKAVVLEMRHELEGHYDNAGKWFPGDLEQRLAEIGVRKDRESAPVDELALADEDVAARKIIDAYISLRQQAGVDRADAVAEYVRESAYTWANRLVALRCMEARELLDDEVIVGREAYGGRSLVHHRLAQTSPELCTGEDDGRFAMLFGVFAERAETLPMLFDPESPSIALRPSPPALKNCLAWLSGSEKVRSHDPATDAVFAAPDALGWAYQYWNTEEKQRVFDHVKDVKGAKIEGADIIPATQLYTEDYMVKFLVQNSLGATWIGMHPESQLFEGWEYYVRDADRAPAKKKSLRQLALLDPACGSGHFLIEAFDMFFAMYEEEGEISDAAEICKSILENNLFGIDIDERAIQIAEASLWMKAEEKAFGFSGATTNLVAATSSHLKGESWERYLAKLKKEPSTVRVLRRFAAEMEHIDELGSLARPAEALESIIKQEHELWEKQERERHEADKSLFKEIRDDVLASQLPFQDITDQKFFERTMQHALFAIDGFTAEARESGEFNDQLMGVEAKTGFRLLDLLSRKYDVVVANPPYMGSKNMGPQLKKFVETYYKPGKRDLYAAFLVRSIEFMHPAGTSAIVSMNKWMHARAYAPIRCGRMLNASGDETGASDPRNLLKDNTLIACVDLGSKAFDPENKFHDGVQVVLSITQRCSLQTRSSVCVIDCKVPEGPERKSAQLLCSLTQPITKISQSSFAGLPGSPLVSGVSNTLLEKLKQANTFGELARVRQGICSTKDPRFVRMNWEVQSGGRWIRFAKGGGHKRWAGLRYFTLDWQSSGTRIKRFITDSPHAIHWSGRMPEPDYFFKGGWAYSRIAFGSLGVRQHSADELFGHTNPIILFRDSVLEENRHGIAALLNSPLTTLILRTLNQSNDFQEGYLRRMPFAKPSSAVLQRASVVCENAVMAAENIALNDPIEYSYTPVQTSGRSLKEMAREQFVNNLEQEYTVAVCEAVLSNLSFQQWSLDEHDIELVMTSMAPTSLGRCLVDRIPEQLVRQIEFAGIPSEESDAAGSDVNASLEADAADFLCGESLAADDDDPDESESDVASEDEEQEPFASKPMPPFGLIERFARLANVSLSEAFQALERSHKSLDRVSKDSIAFTYNLLTASVLQLLGHRWSASSSAEGSQGDDDGIIPLTSVLKESQLQTRMFERCHQDGLELSDVAAMIGKSLDSWLTTEFFKHHVKQFKRRPVAWQLQTSSYTSKKAPVFACLVYYHGVNVDAIQKIRSQYTGPLKLRFDTEMRGISSTPAANRTDNQSKRAVELEEAISELQAFDDKLATIAKSGFGPTKLRPKLRQYAFDDAMLAMKARWLKRLSELLDQSPGEEAADGTRAASPLDQWQVQAIDTGLHPELAEWIGEALSNLDYFCSQVGPKAPEAKKTPDDPTAADFAQLIRPETVTMQTRSIELACGVWWGKFDAAVLAPIKERIKTLKAEQKELNAAIKEDRQPVLDTDTNATVPTGDTLLLSSDEPSEQTTELTKAAMKGRLKEVKAKIKKFTDEMNLKSGKAQGIRDAIRAWNSSEPDQWHDWLAEGPMFDQVASLDDRRTPPKTIAEFIDQESLYAPDINDGVRVNIAPLQKGGVLSADVLAAKDIDKAIADRAEWRSDERRWVREGKLPQCGWWAEVKAEGGGTKVEAEGQLLLVAPGRLRPFKMDDALYSSAVLCEMLRQRPDGMQPIELAQAFCLLTRKDHLRDALVEHVAQVDAELAGKWHGDFDQQPQPEMLRTLLPDLMSRQFAAYDGSVLVPGEKLTPSKNAWPRHDVALALAAAEAMPAAERDEIVEPEVQEMIFKLRLVG